MKSQKNRGKFITLEGPEGAGKSTQARMLSNYLKENGYPAVWTREPGGVSIAEQLREMLLNPDSKIYPRAELLIYAAGRAQHTEELINPALESNKYVICERYIHASLAYQGYGRKLDLGLIRKLNSISTGGVKPDITFIFDIEAAKGLQRTKDSGSELDRLESENIKFHKRVREGYLKLSKENDDIVVLDAEKSKSVLHSELVQVLKKRNII
ncbi:MAG: dTMP kinase [Elusimicrobiota bacterium]